MSATKLTRREQRARAQHFIDTLEGTAFPNSKRIYITGTHPGVRVPMREIQLSPTLIGGSKEQPQYEENEAIPVYDTSGPYGDPQIAINVQQGLAKLRQPWIDARGREEVLRTIHKLNREKGITIVLITHYMDEAVQAGRVVVMDDGQILLQGTPKEVFSHVELLKQHKLDVPQATELIYRLRASGYPLPECVLNEEDCVAALERILKAPVGR